VINILSWFYLAKEFDDSPNNGPSNIAMNNLALNLIDGLYGVSFWEMSVKIGIIDVHSMHTRKFRK
jgi:hypothetical protein